MTNGLVLQYDGVDNTLADGVRSHDAAAQRGAWRYSDDYFNLQEAFATPFGSVGYRMNEGWIYVLHPTDATKLALSQFKDYTATITNPHTLAATLGVDDAGSWIDGASHALGVNDSWTTGFSSSSCRLFSNPRTDVRIFAVRLYNRKLSDAELKWNARVDAGRFLGMPAYSASEPMKLYPPGFMLIFR